jgi:hypothetical protein
MRMWTIAEREGNPRRITLEEYSKAGGWKGAIDEHRRELLLLRPRTSRCVCLLENQNSAFVARAVSQLRGGGPRALTGGLYATRHVEGPNVLNPIDEAPGVSTNTTAQSSLVAIQVLELCKEQLPAELPPAPQGGRGRRGG